MPPCIVALIAQSKYFVGEPKGSTSTIEPLLPFFEYELKKRHISSSEVSKFEISFSFTEFCAMFSPSEFTSLATTISTFEISFATLRDLAPRPANPSRNIFGLSKFSQNAE